MFPYIKEAISQVFGKPSTENFPAVVPEAPDGYRGRIVYHPELCINCGMCMRVCAPQAMTRTVVPVEDGDQVTLSFNLGSCTFCQMCVDFCSRHAIEMSKDYMMVVEDEKDLVVSGTFIKKKPVPKPKPAAPAAGAAKPEAAPAGEAAKEAKPAAAPAEEAKPAAEAAKPEA